jgi:hypothetical protein
MKKFAIGIAAICFHLIPLVSQAQGMWKGYEKLFQPARNYVVYQTYNDMTIDGKDDEPSWKQAAWTDEFFDIEGSQKPQPKYRTSAKMVWDKNYLYILAELEEPQIWAYYSNHDQIVYHENDFEVFIDPEGDGRNYLEFEVNARNTLFDLLITKPYRNGGIAQISWDSKGFKSAVSIDGTLNNPGDKDKKWAVEMAIPFESLKTGAKNPVPANGQTWKIDFSRVEWQSVVVNGKYQKKQDEKTGRDLSENNWVWSPTGEINMHVPERWGMVQFSSSPVNEDKVAFQMPQEEELRKFLWLAYYKQHDFKKANGRFASSLSDLKIPSVIDARSGKSASLKLMVTGTKFTVLLTTKEGLALSVNEDGLIQNGQPNN